MEAVNGYGPDILLSAIIHDKELILCVFLRLQVVCHHHKITKCVWSDQTDYDNQKNAKHQIQ